MRRAAVDELDIPAGLMRALHRCGVQTIAQLESLTGEALLSVRFLNPADIPTLRAAVQAYWQRIQQYAESALSPTDRRAVDIWMQRQQGASVEQLAAELSISGAYVRQVTERGARYIRSRNSRGSHEQELPPPPQDLSIREAAAVLGLSPDTVRKRIKRGMIAPVKMGVRLHKIPLAEVDRYRNTQQETRAPRLRSSDQQHR